MWLFTPRRVCIFMMVAVAFVGCVHQVRDLQQRAMYANHEAEVSALQSALVAAWVHQQVAHQQPIALAQKAVNPMRFMYLPKFLYVGEIEYLSDDLKNVWIYDKQQHCLVYVFNNGETRAYQLRPKVGSREGMELGIWQLQRVANYQPNKIGQHKLAS